MIPTKAPNANKRLTNEGERNADDAVLCVVKIGKGVGMQSGDREQCIVCVCSMHHPATTNLCRRLQFSCGSMTTSHTTLTTNLAGIMLQ